MRPKVHIIRATPSQSARRRAEDQARAFGAHDARQALEAARTARGTPSAHYLMGFLSAISRALAEATDPVRAQSALGREAGACGVEIGPVTKPARLNAEQLFRRGRAA